MAAQILTNEFKVLRGNTLAETALTGVSALPASGSFIDVKGYEWVHVIIHYGTLHTSDSPSFQLKEAESASGTLDVLDATNLALTPDVDADDGQLGYIYLDTEHLSDDHNWVSLAVSGTLTNGSYVDVTYLLGPALHQPVVQTTAQMPTDNIVGLSG